jgi:tRNA(fMet)-specific endonuclease VapC
MARYMLDTNMCIYLMKNQPEEVARRFAECYVGDVVMSAITYAELEYGVAVSAEPEREQLNLANLIADIHVAPFDGAAAVAYGPIRLATRDSKKDHLDKLIAAHAVALKVTLVTNNLKDFAKYPGVVTENWLIAPVGQQSASSEATRNH